MSIKSDRWIRRMAAENGMIDPFSPEQVRVAGGHKIVSYGTSSYGYDVRCAEEFKIFTNINSTIVDPKNFDEASREHYAALYARAGAMHAGFEQFKAFDQDAIDNKAFVAAGLLTMPVLAVGGEKSFGPMMATVMRAAATNVTAAIIPNSGHWVMEENPTATIKLITDFIAK